MIVSISINIRAILLIICYSFRELSIRPRRATREWPITIFTKVAIELSIVVELGIPRDFKIGFSSCGIFFWKILINMRGMNNIRSIKLSFRGLPEGETLKVYIKFLHVSQYSYLLSCFQSASSDKQRASQVGRIGLNFRNQSRNQGRLVPTIKR